MKQISEGDTTTSSRPAFMGLAAASLMAPPTLLSTRDDSGCLVPQRLIWGKVARDPILCPMSRPLAPVVDFYNRHPISEGQIIDALRRQGKDLKWLAPEDLYDFDQDHYGGLEAVEALGRRAGIDASSHVLDVCAGLAGPARFMARRWGARVTALDLNPDRAEGARRLSAAVGLGGLVRMVRADAQALPFRAHAFTAVVSQEGLLHVPDKAATLAECRRVLLRGQRADTVARLGQARYDEYDQLYAFFVGLVEAGKLGGARFSATAGPGAFSPRPAR